jgi:hypothetical protein
MTKQEAAAQFERMQHQKEQHQVQQATALGNIGGQHAGQLINVSNMLGAQAADQDQNYMTRIAMGQEAANQRRQEKERADAYRVNHELKNRDYANEQLNDLQRSAQVADKAYPETAPQQSLRSYTTPEYIPNPQRPVSKPLTEAIGAGVGLWGMANNITSANQISELNTADLALKKAELARQQNQIPQTTMKQG